MPYRSLNPDQLRIKLEQINALVSQKFPDSGLSHVSREMLDSLENAVHRLAYLKKPLWALRISVSVPLIILVVLPFAATTLVEFRTRFESLAEFLEGTDAALHLLFVVGGLAIFLFTLEKRIKRTKALNSLSELRSLAHVIDMHQLAKDPILQLEDEVDGVFDQQIASDSRTVRTRRQLADYLDFCGDMLSLVGKMAALYAQTFNDRDVLVAVNEIEILCTGTARKIWQKLMILNQMGIIDK